MSGIKRNRDARYVFVEYIAMMWFWVFAAYYVSKGIRRIPASKNSVQKKATSISVGQDRLV